MRLHPLVISKEGRDPNCGPVVRLASLPSYGVGFEADANASLTAEVDFSQLQANKPSGQGARALFDRLAADIVDGTLLGVKTIGGPIGWPFAMGMLPTSVTAMLFCC